MFYNKVISVGISVRTVSGTNLLLIISIEISSIYISAGKIGLVRDFQHLFTAAWTVILKVNDENHTVVRTKSSVLIGSIIFHQDYDRYLR